MLNTIKVFHVEDYRIIRDGVKLLLSQDPQIEIVGEATHGERLFSRNEKINADVLLLDLYLDGMDDTDIVNGFEICRQLRRVYPAVKVIAHSMYDDADKVARIIHSGAWGFVSKKAGYEELIHAVKVVHSGGKYVCKQTARKMKNLQAFLQGDESELQSNDEIFTKREKEVLQLLAEGYSSRAIANKLLITEKTVESHRKNLVSKAGVKNTVELIAFTSMRGIIKK